MFIYILATLSTTLLIALVLILGIVMLASQLWIVNGNSDLGVRDYIGLSHRSNSDRYSFLKQTDSQEMDKLIKRLNQTYYG